MVPAMFRDDDSDYSFHSCEDTEIGDEKLTGNPFLDFNQKVKGLNSDEECKFFPRID